MPGSGCCVVVVDDDDDASVTTKDFPPVVPTGGAQETWSSGPCAPSLRSAALSATCAGGIERRTTVLSVPLSQSTNLSTPMDVMGTEESACARWGLGMGMPVAG